MTRIIVGDDDPEILEKIKQQLESEIPDCVVRVFTDRDRVSSACDGEPDLLIINEMGNQGGLAMAVRAHFWNIPVIITCQTNRGGPPLYISVIPKEEGRFIERLILEAKRLLGIH